MLVQLQAVNPVNEQERVFVNQTRLNGDDVSTFLNSAHLAWVLKEYETIPRGWVPKIVYENEQGFFKLTPQGVVTQ